MSSDVVLTAALRNNLLSLQSTQSLIDTSQLRLATGRKVNSALDGPQAFFAAQSLSNRANDLSRLLDGIGQSIQVIKAADNGITALTKLVEQAESVAQEARDALASGQAEAKVVGDRDLSGINDLTALTGIAANDTLIFTVTQDDGTAINIGNYGDTGGALTATETVTITANMSTEELIAAINNIHFSNLAATPAATGAQALEASLNEEGQLEIKTTNGGNLNINVVSAAATDVANLAQAADLGFGNLARLLPDGGAGSNNVEVSAIADVALRSYALYDNSGTTKTLATRADLITTLETQTSGTDLFQNVNANTDDYLIGINGGSQQTIELFQNGGAITIQEFIDQVNNNTSLNTKILASFDDETGQVIIEAIDGGVQSIEIGVADNNQTLTANFGFGINDLSATATDGRQESIRLASAAGDLLQFEDDFNNIREQIDALVADTGYRGSNLLNGDDLLTTFNEDRTSTLTTEGVTFTASGLGLDEADFARDSTVEAALEQVREALASVRSFGSSLANDLAIIQSRESFTKELINTLNEGADKLTIADQNEEGAKLLALQTRQQLGVTSLSLASQSQQSILRLF